MKTIALIGDIVDSKKIPRRMEFQERLAGVLKAVSTRNSSLVSPYTITLGDEFQAVYKSADTLFVDVFAILAEIHPVQARFAAGLGEITTAINRKQALGMDGPAFHRAREAIVDLKKTGYLLRFSGETATPAQGAHWKLIGHLFNLVSHEVSGWEQNRLRIMHGMLAGKTIAGLEKELQISTVAVYKNINAAALDEVLGLCEEITRMLNRELKTP